MWAAGPGCNPPGGTCYNVDAFGYECERVITMAADSLLVFTTIDDADAARRLADSLVADRAVACVNILPPVTSVFRWESGADDAAAAQVQAEAEIMLLMKTTTDAYARLEAQLQAEHPYELPEIIAVPVERGLPGFLQWIDSATRE